MVDEDGFPRNPEYLEAQGWDLVAANRELVQAQTQLDQLAGFYAMLADPATRDEALAAFDAELERGTGRTTQRPSFPGHYSEQSQEDPNEAWERARKFGMPAGQEHIAQQLWQQVPAEVQVRKLLNDLSGL